MTKATEDDYGFNKTINITYIDAPYDIHIVQTNNEEVNVYDHGHYLYSTKTLLGFIMTIPLLVRR